MGSLVRVPGISHGMARVERCEVLARIDSMHGQPRMLRGLRPQAPEGLPDGKYLASFDGYTLQATKDRGLWLTSNNVIRPT
jgi:hypothetical protein